MKRSWFVILSVCVFGWHVSAQDLQQHIVLGQKARETHNLGEAEKEFRAAIQEAKKSHGKDIELADGLSGLAAVYRDQDKNSQSQSLYKKSLAIREKNLGPWDLTVAQTLDNIAGLLASQGKHDKAEPLYRRARQIREQAMAAHPDVYIDNVPKPVVIPK